MFQNMAQIVRNMAVRIKAEHMCTEIHLSSNSNSRHIRLNLVRVVFMHTSVCSFFSFWRGEERWTFGGTEYVTMKCRRTLIILHSCHVSEKKMDYYCDLRYKNISHQN